MTRLSKEAWIEKFGAAEMLAQNLTVVPCYCTDDPSCAGWQVVYPGQAPSKPMLRAMDARVESVYPLSQFTWESIASQADRGSPEDPLTVACKAEIVRRRGW